MPVEADAEIINQYGFHARPSTSFSTLAKQFKSSVTVAADGAEVDGKSIMGLMSLGVQQGKVIRIQADGEDEQEALAALTAHVADRFGGID